MKNNVRQLTITALLIALGIIIPMVMPKIVIPPASFTLASHVPIFIAMFFSPVVAIIVAIGTAFGFFLTLPPVIAIRALSHVVFAAIGSAYLIRYPKTVMNVKKFQVYNIVISLIHAVVEVLSVAVFYLVGGQAGATFDPETLYFLIVLLGFGGFVHSMVDYNIAYFVVRSLSKGFEIPVFRKAKATAIAE